jgi:hypothetical protein
LLSASTETNDYLNDVSNRINDSTNIVPNEALNL